MPSFSWLENSFIGVWVREAIWGFPAVLTIHAWSMAFLVGISIVLALSVLGFVPRLLMPLLEKYLPVTWLAFIVSLVSGVVLIATYPDKVFANPMFYVKLGFIAIALTLAVSLRRRCAVLTPEQTSTALPLPLKMRAVGILFSWFCTIAAGKLLYYTYSNVVS